MPPITIQPNDRHLTRYYSTIKELRAAQAEPTEGNMRRAFGTLLTSLGRRRKLTLIDEYATQGQGRRHIRPDGALIDEWKRPFAFWEAKDTSDNLYAEIENKKAAGYPLDNIIFEDTVSAVLYQGRLRSPPHNHPRKEKFRRAADPILQLQRTSAPEFQ